MTTIAIIIAGLFAFLVIVGALSSVWVLLREIANEARAIRWILQDEQDRRSADIEEIARQRILAHSSRRPTP